MDDLLVNYLYLDQLVNHFGDNSKMFLLLLFGKEVSENILLREVELNGVEI